MQELNFFEAVSLTNQTTRKTTDKAVIEATPTDGNLRVSSVAGEKLGVDYDVVMDKEGEGQYIDIKQTADDRLFAYLVPSSVDEIRGGKLAANAVGSNLTFSNKAVYLALGGVPSSPDKDVNLTVRWELSEEGVTQADENDVEYTFFELTLLDKKESPRRVRSTNSEENDSEESTNETTDVDFDD